MAKGGGWERRLCHLLSLWFSDGARDDLFWRTATSGGRATVRANKGAATEGQHGDLCATCPAGEPFTRALTVECKRGYNLHTVQDLLDKPKGGARQLFEKWVGKVTLCQGRAGTFSWLLIAKRDRREPLVFFPAKLMRALIKLNALEPPPCPLLSLTFPLDSDTGANGKALGPERVYGMTLGCFFSGVSPAHVKALGGEKGA